MKKNPIYCFPTYVISFSFLVHDGVKYSCPYQNCDRKFSQTGQVKLHIESDHKGKRLECEICGRSFKCKGELNRHKKKTHSVKNYEQVPARNMYLDY